MSRRFVYVKIIGRPYTGQNRGFADHDRIFQIRNHWLLERNKTIALSHANDSQSRNSFQNLAAVGASEDDTAACQKKEFDTGHSRLTVPMRDMHLQTLEQLDLKQLAHHLEKLGSSSILHRLNEHGANLDVQAFSSERNMLRIRLRNLQTAMKHNHAVSGEHYAELTMRLESYTAAAARLAVLFIFAERVSHTPQRTRLISDYLTAVKPLIEHWRHKRVEQSLQLIENAGLALRQLGIKKRFNQYAQFDAAVRRARRLLAGSPKTALGG